MGFFLKNADLKPIFSLAKKITFAAVFFSAILVLLYFYNFGSQNNFQLSPVDSAWANFGSYIGGVLGPLFSFLAFAGVLITVWLQAIQIDISKSQAKIEEFQRVIANVSLQLDGLLAHRLEVKPIHPALVRGPETVFYYISAAGTAAIASPSNYIVEARNKDIIDTMKPLICSIVSVIGIELQQLAWCIDEYKRIGGAESVSEFYKNRYQAVVGWLDALSFLNTHSKVHACWDVILIRQTLCRRDLEV